MKNRLWDRRSGGRGHHGPAGLPHRNSSRLHAHRRPTSLKPSVPTTPGDRFYEMMGYNPRPGHASDEAILGVLAAEMDQERLTA